MYSTSQSKFRNQFTDITIQFPLLLPWQSQFLCTDQSPSLTLFFVNQFTKPQRTQIYLLLRFKTRSTKPSPWSIFIFGSGFCLSVKIMAFSTGFATAFAGSKVETLLFNPGSSSSSCSFLRGQQIRVLCKSNRNEKRFQRGVRCEVASPSDASTVSALEQLKTSALDRKYCIFSFFFCLCVVFELFFLELNK